MTFDMYNKQLLRLAASVPHIGELDNPDVTVTEHNRLCGSWITVDLKVEDGVIVEFAQRMEACVVSQAVASILAGMIIGLARDDIDAGAEALRNLLQDKQVPPSGPWTVLEPVLPISDVLNRHGSAMLPFDAVKSAFDQLPKS